MTLQDDAQLRRVLDLLGTLECGEECLNSESVRAMQSLGLRVLPAAPALAMVCTVHCCPVIVSAPRYP